MSDPRLNAFLQSIDRQLEKSNRIAIHTQLWEQERDHGAVARDWKCGQKLCPVCHQQKGRTT